MKTEYFKYMREALQLAEKAASMGEVPVGAVVVLDGEIIGRGSNHVESEGCALLHAEMLAIREASETLGRWRLTGCTLYTTLEPCVMCVGGILHARVDRLIIGARDLKRGCAGSAMSLLNHPLFNHHVEVEFGILEGESSALLQDFFARLRNFEKIIDNR